jgi:hypothetical protein
MIDYVWQASFVLNGARCEEPCIVGEWSAEGIRPVEAIPKVKFTKVFREETCDTYECVYDRFEDEMAQVLNSIAAGLFFNIDATSFPAISDVKLKLQNELEIIRDRQQLPFRGNLRFTFNVVFTQRNFPNIFASLRTIDASQNRDLIHHSLSLYRHGLSQSDPFDRFFILWRAFNAIYNFHSSRRGEARQIADTLSSKLDQDDLNLLIGTFSNVPHGSELGFLLAAHTFNLFEYLVSLNFTDRYGRDRSSELAIAIASNRPMEIINAAAVCLYVLRCKYAHGSDSQIMQNQEVFTVSSAFLRILLGHLIEKLA